MPRKYTPEGWEAAFWANVSPEPNSGCWLWAAALNAAGYGTFKQGNLKRLAHRISLDLHGVVVPPGLVADHLCRVRCCVNPAHLEAVTEKENMRRGMPPAARIIRSGACAQGHKYDAPNGRRGSNGRMYCRACDRFRAAQHVQRRRMQCEAA